MKLAAPEVACDLLLFVDERVETRRRHDLPRVTCWSVTAGLGRFQNSCHLTLGSWWGLFLSGSLVRKRRRGRPLLLPEQEDPLGWCCFFWGSQQSRFTSRLKAALSFPTSQVTVHLLQALNQISSQNIPAVKSHSQTSFKKTQPPCPELGVAGTQVFCLGLTLSCFYSLFLYKRKLFKSQDDSQLFKPKLINVWFLSMLWYTTPVLTKGRTHFVCWCSHLWHTGGYVCIASFLLLMFLCLNPAHAIWKPLNLCDVACVVCSAEGCWTVSPFCKLWKYFLLLLLFCRS